MASTVSATSAVESVPSEAPGRCISPELKLEPWNRAIVKYPSGHMTDLGRQEAHVTLNGMGVGCIWRLDDGTFRAIRRSFGPGGYDVVRTGAEFRYGSKEEALDALRARLASEPADLLGLREDKEDQRND